MVPLTVLNLVTWLRQSLPDFSTAQFLLSPFQSLNSLDTRLEVQPTFKGDGIKLYFLKGTLSI